MSKCMIRFFTIADYEEEEIWLREQHKKGWEFNGMTVPCFYHFKECEPKDIVYRLDFKNGNEGDDYMQMYADFGWEYAGKCIGWNYFRKPYEGDGSDAENELFSDNESRFDMIQKIILRRMLPIFLIFLCCVLPQTFREVQGVSDLIVKGCFGFLFILYLYLILHCGVKLMKLRNKYSRER